MALHEDKKSARESSAIEEVQCLFIIALTVETREKGKIFDKCGIQLVNSD